MARKAENTAAPTPFILPPQLTGKSDIAHLLNELAALEDASVGHPDKNSALTKLSSLLNQTAQANGYKLTDEAHRHHVADQLAKIRDHAPVLHISFASEPSPNVTEVILNWLRTNIHRYALVSVGLQPTIAAGCVLRTPNKIFDMSLRSSLQKQTPYLLKLIKGAQVSAPAVAVPGKP